MAKYATKRKRSYKKRRTIRKLKTTLRRKIQRGGDPLLIKLFFIIFIALFSNSPLGRAFITILEILSGSPIQNGDSSSQNNITQRGGGRLGDALKVFNDAVKVDQTILGNEKTEINRCVDELTSDNALSEPTPATDSPIVDNTSINPTQSNNIDNLKSYFRGIIDKMKVFILTKVNFIKDDNKKKCMITILNVGFTLMKTKLSSMKLKELVAANAMVLAQKGKDIAANAKGQLTNMLSNRGSIASSVASSMPQNLQQGKEMVSQVLNNKEQTAQKAKSFGSEMFKTHISRFGFGSKTS
jgi:hypothetical protein